MDLKALASLSLLCGMFCLWTAKVYGRQGPPILPVDDKSNALAPSPVPGGPPEPPPLRGLPSLSPDFLKNAPLAVETATSAKAFLQIGPVWLSRAPRGEVVYKVALLYQGVAVGCLEFDPASREVLPRGYHPRVFSERVSPQQVKTEAMELLERIQVLRGAEFREPEACWVVPLAVDGKVVSSLKVSYDGLHIVPDYPLQSELRWVR